MSAAVPKLKAKNKVKPPSHSNSDDMSVDTNSESKFAMDVTNENIINIETVYDTNLRLVQIKFIKNKNIPRAVMKIIGLIMPFHTTLSAISIDSGLHKETIYEISKLLPVSRITEICLDYTYLTAGNYHILLGKNPLKHLSLSKCKINDAVVQTIASNLVYPSPASKTLSVLNLATNKITDLGVTYLADALRSNRQLSYLNLADNMITDAGAIRIFESFEEFSLTDQETISRKSRHIIYLKKKNELILKTAKDLRAGDFDKKTTRRKSFKPIATPPSQRRKTLENESIVTTDTGKSVPNMDYLNFERAEIIVESLIGSFIDPFSPANTEMKDGVMCCYGNNTLCYLNLAYNNLTYFSLKKLCEVLLTQKLLNRKPKGLINVIIEGNSLPVACTELQQINDLLESGFGHIRRMSAATKKKASSSRTSSK